MLAHCWSASFRNHIKLFGRQFQRTYSHNHSSQNFPTGFTFLPAYFTVSEQMLLLEASLHKLDSCDTRGQRKRRSTYWTTNTHPRNLPNDVFAPDHLYAFEEGHYDGVIHHFREIHLTSWPVDEFMGLQSVLERLHSLCPTTDSQTHLLHLASHGDILPHIDNISASGSWILGVSLGAERRLRLSKADTSGEDFTLDLPSGSVYIQRDLVRYNHMHSIERGRDEGQRLSIMIRDRNPVALPLL